MDHIKNSPNLKDFANPELEGATPAIAMALDHPNTIGELTPWQIDFRQLEPGRLSTKITVRAGRSVSALSISMDQRVHQRGASPDGWITFGIPAQGAIETWQGKQLTDAAFLSFGDRDGFEGVTTSGFSGNVVSFETDRLLQFAQTCGFSLSDSTPEARRVRSNAGSASMRRLNRHVSNLLHISSARWTAAVEEKIMLDALSILTDSDAHFDKSQVQSRRRAMKRAVDLMHAHLEDPVSIEEICRQSGASWRTLNRAFKEHFGQGPKSYYMRLRLNCVREQLFKSSDETTITDAANSHGFWHMGQFARDYKLFFGELPSDTRRH